MPDHSMLSAIQTFDPSEGPSSSFDILATAAPGLTNGAGTSAGAQSSLLPSLHSLGPYNPAAALPPKVVKYSLWNLQKWRSSKRTSGRMILLCLTPLAALIGPRSPRSLTSAHGSSAMGEWPHSYAHGSWKMRPSCGRTRHPLYTQPTCMKEKTG